MTTRSTEQFEVFRTHTERFKKSAGIEMKSTLNTLI